MIKHAWVFVLLLLAGLVLALLPHRKVDNKGRDSNANKQKWGHPL